MASIRITRAVFALSALGLLSGCGTSHEQKPRTAADTLSDAEERIIEQRLTKQELLRTDPIERQIEAYLKRDRRVASARFSIPILRYASCDSRSELRPFAVVVTTRERMSQDDALALLGDACASAGYRLAYWDKSEIAMDKDTWGLAWGSLLRLSTANPDLSPLRPAETEQSKEAKPGR